MKYFIIALLVLLTSACGSNPPAPVVDRTAQSTTPKSTVNVDKKANKVINNNDWRPDYHVVKKGDTLISMGLQYGYYYKDIAAANNIEAPYIIKIGQIINLSSINGNNSLNDKNELNNTTEEEGVVLTPLKSNTGSNAESNSVSRADVMTSSNNPIVNKPDTVVKSNNTSSISGAKPAKIPTISEPKAAREPYSLTAMSRVEPAQSQPDSKNNAEKPAITEQIESKKIDSKPTDIKPIDPKASQPKLNNNENDAAKDVTTGEVLVEPSSKINDAKLTDAQALKWIWPTNGKVISNFNESSNKGLDIGGQMSQAINAASAGKVIYSGSDLRGYGKLVIIKHNKTYLSVYAHNSKIIVKEGQSVTIGQKIAEMGDTDSSSVKLHFEIRRLGKSVNPAQYLN